MVKKDEILTIFPAKERREKGGCCRAGKGGVEEDGRKMGGA